MGSFLCRNTVTDQESPEMKYLRQKICYLEKVLETKRVDELEYLRRGNTIQPKTIPTTDDNGGHTNANLSDKSTLHTVSEYNAYKYIDSILENPDTNISWLPDSVERKIYKNMFMLILNVIETTLENTGVHFAGHRLGFVIDPIMEPSIAPIMKPSIAPIVEPNATMSHNSQECPIVFQL